MADQKNQNQGSQQSQTGNKNPQGQQSSQQPSSTSGNRDKEEQRKKDDLTSDRERSGTMGTRDEERETPEGRTAAEPRAEDEDGDEPTNEEREVKRKDRL